MAKYDPSDDKVDDVLKKLEKADEDERERILAAEMSGRKRKTILEAYDIDPDERRDASGTTLYPWEVAPEDQVVPVKVDETDEQRKAREAQAEQDQLVATAGEQGASTPAGTGVTGGAGGTAAGGGTAGGGTTAGGGRAAGLAGASGNTATGPAGS